MISREVENNDQAASTYGVCGLTVAFVMHEIRWDWWPACRRADGDGTHFSGTVFLSSSKEIQFTGDDKISHTIPMTQVRGIEYDDAEPNIATAPPSAEPARSTPPTPAAAPRRPTRSLVHEHPTENQVTTKTHFLPSGTEISV